MRKIKCVRCQKLVNASYIAAKDSFGPICMHCLNKSVVYVGAPAAVSNFIPREKKPQQKVVQEQLDETEIIQKEFDTLGMSASAFARECKISGRMIRYWRAGECGERAQIKMNRRIAATIKRLTGQTA